MTQRKVQSTITGFKKTGIDVKDDRATEWLARNLSKIKTNIKQEDFIEKGKTLVRKSLTPGKMIFYGYMPKTKDVLEFWDEFPVVVIIDPQPGGFLGLNLHYLPPTRRARFLNELLKYVNTPDWDKNTSKSAEFRVGYSLLKTTTKMKDFRPCIKRYYYKHIVTKVSFIEPINWKTVPFFPLDKFKGASRADIWSLA